MIVIVQLLKQKFYSNIVYWAENFSYKDQYKKFRGLNLTTLKQIRVVIASPSDVKEEREALDKVIDRVNRNTAKGLGLVLKTVRWETDSYPGFHIDGPQGLIDPIIDIENCDILIGIFWKKFGTPTKDGKTGTEHEFYKAYESWKQKRNHNIMIYFNQKAYFPKNIEESKQQTHVLEFKENLPKEGLSWNYSGLEQFKEFVYDHLTNYIQDKYKTESVVHVGESSITVSSQEIENILDNYKNSLKKKVSKIRLLGDNKEYNLTEVFVDLIINEQYDRPSFQSLDEYKGMMDHELRKKRILFSDDHELRKKFVVFSDHHYQTKNDDQNKKLKDQEKKIKKIKPEDLLKSEKKSTIIVGAPGSGKSTLIRYLVHKVLQQKGDEYFPIYLELKKIQRKELDDQDKFEDIILSEAVISQSGINNDNAKEKRILEVLREKIRDGKIAFFLDGLDEMQETDTSHNNISLRDLFNKFVESEYISKNLVIVTTRPYALQARFDSYQVQEMEIASFDMGQIKQFITHYFGYDNHGAKRFLHALSSHTEIQDLARVPLILGFLLHIYIKSKSMSKNKLDIYQNIVTNLNNQLDEEKGIKRNFSIKIPIHRFKILTRLAFSGLLNSDDKVSNRFIFSEDRLYEEVTKYCSENRHLNLNSDYLFEDIRKTALLREIGNEKYAFTHLTIQEYLAATVLVKDKNLDKLFCQAYFDPTICEIEILPMTIGLSQSNIDNSQVNLHELLKKLPESLNFANFRLRVRGLGYSPRLVDEKYLVHIADRLIEFVTEKNEDDIGYKQIIFNAFSSLTAENKKYISRRLLQLRKNRILNQPISIINLINVLGRLYEKDALSGLIDLLKDENSDVRVAAASALRGTQDKDAISRLLDLMKDEDVYLRNKAASALSGTQDKDAISRLLDLLNDENSDVRVAAASALSGTQDKDAISRLLDLMKDENSDVRVAAASALSGTQDKDAISRLLDLMKDENSDVRVAAASALSGTQDKDAISRLLDLMKDENSDIRYFVASALRGTQDKDAISSLLDLMKDEDVYLRNKAASALSGTTDKNTKSRLIDLLKDGNAAIRRVVAASALGGTQDKDAISRLIDLLKDEDSDVRRVAASALGGTQDKDAISGLIDLLKDENADIRLVAASALRGTQDKDAISRLIDLLKDEDSYVRYFAASALSGTQDKDALSGLLDLLKDKDSYVRYFAASALSGTQDKDALSGLLDLLKDKDSDVRVEAASALSGTQDKDALSGLLDLLNDENSDVRVEAASALQSYDHSILSKGLLMALSYNDIFVRKKSISVIGYYSNEEAEKKLNEIIKNDQNQEIKKIAEIELEKLQFKMQMIS